VPDFGRQWRWRKSEPAGRLTSTGPRCPRGGVRQSRPDGRAVPRRSPGSRRGRFEKYSCAIRLRSPTIFLHGISGARARVSSEICAAASPMTTRFRELHHWSFGRMSQPQYDRGWSRSLHVCRAGADAPAHSWTASAIAASRTSSRSVRRVTTSIRVPRSSETPPKDRARSEARRPPSRRQEAR